MTDQPKAYWESAGFYRDTADTEAALNRLRALIDTLPSIFGQFSDSELTNRPAAGKWSRKEILGHLVDSAVNNLKRFTEVPFSPQPYKVVSYKQVELVKVNRYQDLPLDHLLTLWQSLNRQIAFVMESTADDALRLPVDPQYDNGEMRTLAWIMCDYVAHMEHHLKQL